ncbi:MAG: response regulator [Microvirga sp.]
MSQEPRDGTHHALVVDDDALILMEATDILEDAGFEVLEAMNFAQALQVLDKNHDRVQLLFTDVHMPGDADGFALARHVSEHWPHIAVVVASGQAEPGHGDLPDGATFIAKPFSAEIVRHHLRRTLPDEKHPGPLRNGNGARN